MTPTFRGNGYVNGKLRPGLIVIEGDLLRFSADEGAGRLDLALNSVRLRFGGHNDSQMFFEDLQDSQKSVHTSDLRILNTPQLQAPQHKAAIDRFDKGRKRTPAVVYLFGGIILFLIAIVVALFLLKNRMVEWVADKIPATWEQQLGDKLIASIEGQGNFITDDAYLSKLTAITNRLIPAAGSSGYNFKFYVMRDTNINAFAIPGGHVVIHTALLDAASSKEEIAGVLAHELAHVTERHSIRKLVESAGLFLLVRAALGDTEGIVKLVTDSSQTLLRQKFSRDFEREADDKGWEFLVAARIDPRGMTSFFKRLREEEEKKGGGSSLSLLNTHPPTTERIDRLEKRWQDQPQKDRFERL